LSLLVYDKRNLIQISSCTTVEEALFVLQRENILAVAVTPENEDAIRILTIFDLLAHITFGSFKYGEEGEADAFSLFKSANVPVSDIVRKPIHAEDENVWTFKSSDPIDRVFEPLSKGVHRVLVDLNNGEGKPQYRLLSQTDVVRFLSSYSLIDPTVNTNEKLKNLNIITRKVKAVHEHTRALDVFRGMQIDDILAVPLVNNDGKLTATLSASDLRGLRSYQLKSILLPAIEYLYIYKGPTARRSVTCTEEDTLNDAITKLVINRIHRVWIVNDLHEPIGVLTLSDVIGKFVVY